MTPARVRLTLVVALLVGVIADQALRGHFWPLGFAVCVVASGIALLLVGGPRPFHFAAEEGGRDRLVLVVVMLLAAVALVLRSADVVRFFDLITLFGCAALLVWRMSGRALVEIRPFDVPVAGVRTGIATLIGMPMLLRGVTDPGSASAGDRRKTMMLVIGCILAVPPVLLVAVLLGEADPAFGSFIEYLTALGFEELIGHAMMIGVITWGVAGWLRGASRAPEFDLPPGIGVVPKFDFFAAAPALYAVSVLLAAYLAFQARALFGGEAYVEATMGLTYAEYARRGFFELVAVTAIVLGMLLVADWALDPDDGPTTRRFRTVGWVVVTLVAVLMASALQRMWVYVSFFGLSDTRLYATAGMTWLGVALGWFGWTVLRGRRARFGFGLLVASAAWVAVLNVMNPEAVVVRVNIARALNGKSFDVIYHGHLSADATDALLQAAPKLIPGDCRGLLGLVHDDRAGEADRMREWQSWSLPVAQAGRALSGTREEVLDARCPVDPLAVP